MKKCWLSIAVLNYERVDIFSFETQKNAEKWNLNLKILVNKCSIYILGVAIHKLFDVINIERNNGHNHGNNPVMNEGDVNPRSMVTLHDRTWDKDMGLVILPKWATARVSRATRCCDPATSVINKSRMGWSTTTFIWEWGCTSKFWIHNSWLIQQGNTTKTDDLMDYSRPYTQIESKFGILLC